MHFHSEKQKTLLADITLLFVAAIWGGGFVAAKIALTGLEPIAILMYRFCGSALLFGILFFPRIRRSGILEFKYGLIIGALQFLGLFIQLVALKYTTSAKQSFIAASYVVFTPLAAWMITRIKPLKKDAFAAVLALSGIALISLNSQLNIQLGDPLTLLFALVFSVQIVLIGKYAKNLDIIVLTFYQFAFAGLLALALSLLTRASFSFTTREALGGVGYLILINTALAMGLQNVAQRYTKAAHTALILSLESVFGLFFSVLVYKETITPRMGIGCLLVLVAVFVSNGPGVRRQRDKSKFRKNC